jgi:hypothetical protein
MSSRTSVNDFDLRCKNMFKSLDTNHDGFIDSVELWMGLQGTYGMHEDEVNELFKKLDANLDGLISLEEFCNGQYAYNFAIEAHEVKNARSKVQEVDRVIWQVKLDDGWAEFPKPTATELEQSFEKRQSALPLTIMKRQPACVINCAHTFSCTCDKTPHLAGPTASSSTLLAGRSRRKTPPLNSFVKCDGCTLLFFLAPQACGSFWIMMRTTT